MNARRLYDDRGRHPILLRGRNEFSHQPDQFVGEQGVEGAIVHAMRSAVYHLDAGKPRPAQFGDEVTLRQGSGYSAGPRSGMR